MADNITGTGTTFNLPDYAGELFTASPTRTPFLTMIGGLSGGRKTTHDRFPTGQLYAFPDAVQPSISESDSETAPTNRAHCNRTGLSVCAMESLCRTHPDGSGSTRTAGAGKLGSLLGG